MTTPGWMLAGLSLVCALLGPLAGYSADQKIAFVNMEKVFDEYYKTKTANTQLKARADEVDLKRRDLVGDVKTLKNQLDTLSAEARDKSLNDAEREKKRRASEEKYTEYKDAEDKLLEFDRNYRKQFGDQMRQMQTQLVGEIRGVIEIYAKAQGLTIILDSSGKTLNSVESVVYYDPTLDVTAPIIAELNKKAPDAPPAKKKAQP